MESGSRKHGEHGSFLNMNHIEEQFDRTPHLPHRALVLRKVLHPSHRNFP